MIGVRTAATVTCVVAVAAVVAVVAQATSKGTNGEIAVVGADGTGFRQLPRTKQMADDDPDWSPNGSTIAFTRCPLRNGPCHAMAMRPDGTGLRRLGPASDDRAFPSWSPDGRRIAYVRTWGGFKNNETKYSALYVMTPSGSGARLVVNPLNAEPYAGDVGHSSWSPDGKHLVLEVTHSPLGDPANGHALFVVDADGSNLTQLTPWSLNAGGKPDWSPDGAWILFRAPTKTERGNLYTIAPDGTGLTQVTHFPNLVVTAGSFSPDGNSIVFAKSADVWVMGLDGSGSRRLTHGVSAWTPDWRHGK
jgi:Tol biopolymer transport system component